MPKYAPLIKTIAGRNACTSRFRCGTKPEANGSRKNVPCETASLPPALKTNDVKRVIGIPGKSG
jgi:hypothetical protein